MARPISATLSAMASALRSGRIRLSRNANMPRSIRDASETVNKPARRRAGLFTAPPFAPHIGAMPPATPLIRPALSTRQGPRAGKCYKLSDERVVHHFAETAAAGDDVLVLVQPALLVPPRAGDGGEDVGRAEPAVEAHGVDDHLGVAPAH